MKNNKKIIASQEKHKRKKVKGEITRRFALVLSNRNDSIVRLDAAQSHALGKKLRAQSSQLSSDERRMYNMLFGLTAYSNGRSIARAYFSKALNKCLQTISRYYTQAELLDLIRITQTVNAPNQFFLGPALLNEIVRNYLVGIFPALRKVIGLSLLVSSATFCSNVSQVYKKIHNSPATALKNKKITTRNRFTIAQLELCDMVVATSPPTPPTNNLTFDQLGDIVMNASTIDISPVTENLSNIALTLAGRIKMTAFPAEAILHADASLGKALAKKSVTDPFGYMFKTAHLYCKDKQVSPNWNHMNELMKRHRQTESTPRFIPQSKKAVKREEPKETISIDKREACCQFNEMTVGEKQEWLRAKRLAFTMTDAGPWPVIPIHQQKLTCTH